MYFKFIFQVELEFLAPHIPTLEEKADPKLFASNVRKEMATALGIPLCDLRWPLAIFYFLYIFGFQYISHSFEDIQSKYTKMKKEE